MKRGGRKSEEKVKEGRRGGGGEERVGESEGSIMADNHN